MQFERISGSHGKRSWTLQIAPVRVAAAGLLSLRLERNTGPHGCLHGPFHSLPEGVVRETVSVVDRLLSGVCKWRRLLVTWFGIASGVDVACLVGLCFACGVVVAWLLRCVWRTLRLHSWLILLYCEVEYKTLVLCSSSCISAFQTGCRPTVGQRDEVLMKRYCSNRGSKEVTLSLLQ